MWLFLFSLQWWPAGGEISSEKLSVSVWWPLEQNKRENKLHWDGTLADCQWILATLTTLRESSPRMNINCPLTFLVSLSFVMPLQRINRVNELPDLFFFTTTEQPPVHLRKITWMDNVKDKRREGHSQGDETDRKTHCIHNKLMRLGEVTKVKWF